MAAALGAASPNWHGGAIPFERWWRSGQRAIVPLWRVRAPSDFSYVGGILTSIGAFDVGAGLLQKPFTLSALTDALRRRLDGRVSENWQLPGTAGASKQEAAVG